MKALSAVILVFASCQLSSASTDSLSYYVLYGTDTNYVSDWSAIHQCDHLISIDRSHNKCKLVVDQSPYSGKLTYRATGLDSTVQVFEGEFLNGLIQYGTVLRYSLSGQLILTGQYVDNWKYGVWTTYFDSGEIEAVMKFILQADHPVVEWEYDRAGRLVYFNDEQVEVEQRIRNTR